MDRGAGVPHDSSASGLLNTNIDFVGTTADGGGCNPGFAYDFEHEGHSGFSATGIANNNQLPSWLSAARPDVVVMHLGTNDMWGGHIPLVDKLNALTRPFVCGPGTSAGWCSDAADRCLVLGVVLHELLTGALPYAHVCGKYPTPGGVIDALLRSRPTRPSEARIDKAAAGARAVSKRALLRSQLRGALDVIVCRAMQFEPEQRYDSTDALAGALREFLVRQAAAVARVCSRGRRGTFRSVSRNGSFCVLTQAARGRSCNGSEARKATLVDDWCPLEACCGSLNSPRPTWIVWTRRVLRATPRHGSRHAPG